MSMFSHADVTEADDATPKFNVGGLYWTPDGKCYKYVQFKDAVTYAAKRITTWANAACTAVTNDVSGGSSIGLVPAGLTTRVHTQNYYGFIQVYGAVSGVKLTTADDVAVGEHLVASSTDGLSDGIASNVASSAKWGVATSAVDAATDTCSAIVQLL